MPSSKKNMHTVAFYNIENLFDPDDSAHTLDFDYTPKGKKKWSDYRYQLKINKLSRAISQIGTDNCDFPPAIIGLAEVETGAVLEDLIKGKGLCDFSYGYIHYESPDERGIDVAFLYNKQFFELTESKPIPLPVKNHVGQRDYTRDILWVKGNLNGEPLHIFVNHWPSRRNGKNEANRIFAAELIHNTIAQIKSETDDPKIIIMGDFNDDPTDKSVQHLVSEEFYNPMELLFKKGIGSLRYHKTWYLFDQIIISKNFFNNSVNKHSYIKAEVFNKDFLTDWTGRNKGEPYRTYVGRHYQGGYSDHFPVLLYLELNATE